MPEKIEKRPSFIGHIQNLAKKSLHRFEDIVLDVLKPAIRIPTKALVRTYLNKRHHFEVDIHPDTRKEGAYLAITAHSSVFDVLALAAGDPRDNPPTAPIVREAYMKIPRTFYNP